MTTALPGCAARKILPGADIHDQIIELASERSKLSLRDLSVRFIDGERYFVSEATVYRLLKACDLPLNPSEASDP